MKTNPIEVLVIEQNPVFRKLIREVLEVDGMKVQTTSGASEGLQKGALHRFDVVVTASGAQDLDGLEIVKGFHRASPDTTVIVYSAKATLDQAVECMRLGASDFFSHPFEMTRLVDSVERAAAESDRRRLRQNYPTENSGENFYRMRNILASLKGYVYLLRTEKCEVKANGCTDVVDRLEKGMQNLGSLLDESR